MTIARITDFDIQALVDNQVEASLSLKLLELVYKDPALHHRYQLYQKQKKLLKSWWKDN